MCMVLFTSLLLRKSRRSSICCVQFRRLAAMRQHDSFETDETCVLTTPARCHAFVDVRRTSWMKLRLRGEEVAVRGILERALNSESFVKEASKMWGFEVEHKSVVDCTEGRGGWIDASCAAAFAAVHAEKIYLWSLLIGWERMNIANDIMPQF